MWRVHCWAFISKKYKTVIQKNTSSPLFTTAAVTTAGMRKQPRCPVIGKETKKLWFIYAGEYYSATKNEILAFATGMSSEGVLLSAVSQREKDKSRMISLTCGTSKKQARKQNKAETAPWTQRTIRWWPGGGVGRWMEKVSGNDRHTLPL